MHCDGACRRVGKIGAICDMREGQAATCTTALWFDTSWVSNIVPAICCGTTPPYKKIRLF